MRSGQNSGIHRFHQTALLREYYLIMKNNSYYLRLCRFGQFLHRFRTPLLFWLYLMAMMAYAFRAVPN